MPGGSKLKQFSPFVDVEKHGVLRVGGRLKNAPVDYAIQHPILLPADQQITETIIWDHQRTGHLKTEQLFHSLCSNYWILSARRVIRRQIKNGVPCKRRDDPTMTAMMGSLPVHRLTPSLPVFTNTGLDYFGPVTVKRKGRGSRQENDGFVYSLACRPEQFILKSHTTSAWKISYFVCHVSAAFEANQLSCTATMERISWRQKKR